LLIIFSEINENDDVGLTIELWNRSISWDNLLGLYWLPLKEINHSNVVHDKANNIKVLLDSELRISKGTVIGTQNSTGHSLLINARIETANLNENESLEMQEKLELLNEFLEQEVADI
jgi:hypothetical protein